MSIANDCYRKTDEECQRYPTAERPDVEQPNTLNDIYSDVFGNEFYNVNKDYNRSTLGEYDSTGKWVTQDAPPHEDYIATTYELTFSPRSQ